MFVFNKKGSLCKRVDLQNSRTLERCRECAGLQVEVYMVLNIEYRPSLTPQTGDQETSNASGEDLLKDPDHGICCICGVSCLDPPDLKE